MTVTGSISATHLTYLDWTNGDFETGDLTGWGTGGDAWSETNYASSDSTDPHGGSYCVLFTSTSTTDTIYISQTMNLTQVSSILFWNCWLDGDNVGVFTVSVDDVNVATYAEGAVHTWVQKIIDVADKTGSCSIKYILSTSTTTAPSTCQMYLDDLTVYDTDLISTATIEDHTKSWTADAYNNYTFILTSGASQGYSCKIMDTFTNYIQVPTTFTAINNINTLSGNYEDFEAAATFISGGGYWTAYNGWTNDDELQCIVSNLVAHTGTISMSINQGPE